MKAWRLEKLGGRLALEEIPVPEPRSGSVLVKVEATSLVSYIKAYVEGRLPSTIRRPDRSPSARTRSGRSRRSDLASGG